MTDHEKLIESVRDIPTITRMAHVTQIEKIGELRDALIAAEKAHTPTDDSMSHYADPTDPFWQSSPEPRGEPSDAQVEVERRYPDNSHTASTPFYAQMKREAFIEGVEWARATGGA